MWKKHVEPVWQWLSRVVREPRSELNRWQRAVRFGYDLSRYGAKQLREDRAPQMAAALAYQTLFAMLPVLVVAMILVRALSGVDVFMQQVDEFLTWANLQNVVITAYGAEEEQGIAPQFGGALDPDFAEPPEGDENTAPAAEEAPAPAIGDGESPQAAAAATRADVSLRDWLEGLIGHAAQMNLKGIGWAGFVIILYAVISMLLTIEHSFNTIYRAPEGRPWTRRLPLYWTLTTLSPAALGLIAFAHGEIVEWGEGMGLGDWFIWLIGIAWSVSVGWLFWFGVYSLVPNASIDYHATAIGAVVTVILVEIGKQLMGAYLSNAFTFSQLYGSLGLIPLFMFWVYLMWLVVLFGLEVSATLQFLGNHEIKEVETRRTVSGVVEPAVVVSVMQVAGEAFESGKPLTQTAIADRLGIGERMVAVIVQELCREGFLHRLEGDEKAVALSRPPDKITADELVEVGFLLADSAREMPLSAFSERLREAQKRLAADVSLASIIPRTPLPEGSA